MIIQSRFGEGKVVQILRLARKAIVKLLKIILNEFYNVIKRESINVKECSIFFIM